MATIKFVKGGKIADCYQFNIFAKDMKQSRPFILTMFYLRVLAGDLCHMMTI